MLTPDLQADYLVRYFTVCFSHPNVDLVNLWGGLGPGGWTNSGLIDGSGKILPGFYALKKLVGETFRSKVNNTLPLDGTLHARVFHGTYTVTVKLASGKEATATLEVPQTPTAEFRLRLNCKTRSN